METSKLEGSGSNAKKKLKSKCHRHHWLSFVKFYFLMIGMAIIEKRLSKRDME